MSETAFSDVLLVGFDFTKGRDKTTVLVGRKQPNDVVDVINIIQGPSAMELYEQLVPKEASKNGVR